MKASLAIGLVTTWLASLVPHTACAQDQPAAPADPPRFWGSAYVVSGASPVDGRPLFLDDFRLLAPGSTLLEHDFGDHVRVRSLDLFHPTGSAVGTAALAVGVHPFRREGRPGPEFRWGAQFAGGVLGRLRYESTVRTPYDTLTSTGGRSYHVDSVHVSEYDMTYRAERMGVDVSVVFRTKGKSRWSLHGGLGLGFGGSLNARTTIAHRTESYIGYPDEPMSGRVERLVEERYDHAGGTWFSAYAPLGFGFRLARKGEFMRRIDLVWESRPQVLVVSGSGLEDTTAFGNQLLFGLRVRLD